MKTKRLLLLSNSTMAGEPYLEYPKQDIRRFLGDARICALFLPFAAVTISGDDYESRVRERFNGTGHNVHEGHPQSPAV
jgi:dipeptidase E